MKNFEGYVNNKITPLWYLIADSFTLCSQFKVPILLRTLQMVDNTIRQINKSAESIQIPFHNIKQWTSNQIFD